MRKAQLLRICRGGKQQSSGGGGRDECPFHVFPPLAAADAIARKHDAKVFGL
jgi:hypothetical protein